MQRRVLALISGSFALPFVSISGCLTGSPTPKASPTPQATATPTPSPAPTPTLPPFPRKKESLIISGVEFTPDNDVLVEITNLGSGSVDIAGEKWTWCANFNYGALSTQNRTLAPGAKAKVNTTLKQPCVETAAGWCSASLSGLVKATGNFSLYKGFPASDSGEYANPRTMADFIQWGAAAQPREDEADRAHVWKAGTFVPTPAGTTLSIKVPGDSGKDAWQ